MQWYKAFNTTEPKTGLFIEVAENSAGWTWRVFDEYCDFGSGRELNESFAKQRAINFCLQGVK